MVMQVVALNLRSAARVEEPELPLDQEMDYCTTINRCLAAGSASASAVAAAVMAFCARP
jgi:hypothetical protein